MFRATSCKACESKPQPGGLYITSYITHAIGLLPGREMFPFRFVISSVTLLIAYTSPKGRCSFRLTVMAMYRLHIYTVGDLLLERATGKVTSSALALVQLLGNCYDRAKRTKQQHYLLHISAAKQQAPIIGIWLHIIQDILYIQYRLESQMKPGCGDKLGSGRCMVRYLTAAFALSAVSSPEGQVINWVLNDIRWRSKGAELVAHLLQLPA